MLNERPTLLATHHSRLQRAARGEQAQTASQSRQGRRLSRREAFFDVRVVVGLLFDVMTLHLRVLRLLARVA